MQQDWNLKAELIARINRAGGWVNTHTHLDRAYTINQDSLALGNHHLHQKWQLVDELKRQASVDQIYDRMAFALEKQQQQGVVALLSFIDVDPIIKDKAIQAAQKLKDKHNNYQLLFANQTLKGVLTPESRKWFELGAEFADIIGGLPGKDRGQEAEHLDVLLTTAKAQNKMVHVHVDQLNTATEKETELLTDKVKEYDLTGQVIAIHSVSLAAHTQSYRQKIYSRLRKNRIGVICCPTAWIDARRSEELTPTHNAIAPVEELIAHEVTVALGTDNIADIYKPFSDGDMWTELRFLLESCHLLDLNTLVNIATSHGKEVLGITNKQES